MTKLNSIGIAKDPKDTLVVVAMSGGVDSSTVAAMMKNDGYKVINHAFFKFALIIKYPMFNI